MTIIKKIEFIIDHIDPLGQGVYKKGDDIFFIPKTLPEESGSAIIQKRRKGVHFAKVESIAQTSNKRITPECEHFSNCQGCHFLHCDYESELSFKELSFKKMLKYLEDKDFNIDIVQANDRLHYRNRIQLHYNKKARKLGFVDGKSNRIIEIPKCLICNPEVTTKLKELYKDEAWLKQAPSKPTGHVEIYSTDSGLKINWNKKYAQGGFTQVNAIMNNKMNDLVAKHLLEISPKSVLDLFGGNGNLSNSVSCPKKVVDIYDTPPSKNFLSINLFEEEALSILKNKCSDTFDTFIIDPPRAGFKYISDWFLEFSPKNILYISCHPQTMVRDLKNLQNSGILAKYEMKKVYMLDLFPSTFHFEAMVVLTKR